MARPAIADLPAELFLGVAVNQKNRRSLHHATLQSENISTKGPRNRRSLRSGRDDKERVTVP